MTVDCAPSPNGLFGASALLSGPIEADARQDLADLNYELEEPSLASGVLAWPSVWVLGIWRSWP